MHVNSPVIDIRPADGTWAVRMEDTSCLADHVVVACSVRAREMVARLGLNLPVYPVQHHEVRTGPIVALETLGHEAPAVRDPYAPFQYAPRRAWLALWGL